MADPFAGLPCGKVDGAVNAVDKNRKSDPALITLFKLHI